MVATMPPVAREFLSGNIRDKRKGRGALLEALAIRMSGSFALRGAASRETVQVKGCIFRTFLVLLFAESAMGTFAVHDGNQSESASLK